MKTIELICRVLFHGIPYFSEIAFVSIKHFIAKVATLIKLPL